MGQTTELKQRIIHEALKLFSLKGYLNTSVDEILSAAKASKGGMYNHFRSKDDLFRSVLEEARRIWRARVLAGIDEPLRQLERIKLFLNNYRHNYLKDHNNIPGGCVFVSLSTELDDQHPEFAAELQRGFKGVKRLIRNMLALAQESGELKPGVNLDDICEMLFSCMVGASVLYSMDKSSQTLDQVFEPLIAYLDSLAA